MRISPNLTHPLLRKERGIKKFLNYAATVASCVVIIVLGITFFSRATTVTTSIGENISTNDLIVYGNATTTGAHYIGGNLSVSGSLTTPYFLATSTTATSTFPYLTATQSNVGTVVGGTWNGSTIGVAYGGTGLSSYTANRLLYASGSGTIGQIATSSLGLLTTDVAEGTNLYWTATRFDNRLSATTTLPNLTILLGLTNATTSLLTVSNGAWFTSGNVGIATSSPYAKLSVSGIGVFDDYVRASYFTATSTTATSTFPYLSVTTNSSLGTIVGGTWQGSAIGVTYGGTGLSSISAGQSLFASAANTLSATSTLYLATSGNLGIGTTSPSAKFHLANGNFYQTMPPTLSDVGFINITGANTVYVLGRYAYITSIGATSSLYIVDLNYGTIASTSPTVVGSVQPEAAAHMHGLAVSGGYAYGIGPLGGAFYTFDISNPRSPYLANKYSQNAFNYGYEIYISGKYAYTVAPESATFAVVDIMDPLNPYVVGSFTDTSTTSPTCLSGVNSVYVSGKYAYVGTMYDTVAESITANRQTYFHIFDISNPANPTIVSSNTSPLTFTGSNDTDAMMGDGMDVSGKYAYVTYFGGALKIIDISSSTAPTLITTYTNSLLNGANAVHVSGRYAYIAVEQSSGYSNQIKDMVVVDISDPSAPFISATYDDGDEISHGHDLFVAGKYVYLVLNGSGNSSLKGMRIIDISGIDAPGANIGDLAASSIEVGENLNVGNNLYVRSGLNTGFGGIATDGSLSVSGTGYFFNTVSIGASTTNAFDLRYNVVASSTFDIYDQVSNASRLSINTSGFLGLGTSSPIAKLEVVSDGTNPMAVFDATGSTHPGRTLTIKDKSQVVIGGPNYPGSWAPALQIQNDDNSTSLWMGPMPSDSSGANARIRTAATGLDFYVGGTVGTASSNASGGTLSLMLNSTGAVGVGTGFSTTITPSTLLELRDAATSTIISLTVAASDTTLDPAIVFRTGATPATKFIMGVDYSDSNKFKISPSAFGTNDRFVIDSNGYVGIGTSSPIANFEVVSSATSPTNPIFHVNTGGSSHPSRTFIIKDRARAALNGPSYPGSWVPAFSIQDDGGGKQLWMSPLPSDSGNANARFAALGYIGLDFYMGGAATGPGTLALTLASTSVVGIGSGFSTTVTPASLLEIRDASVAPKITLTAATNADTTLDPAIVFRTGATPATKFIMGVDYSDSNKFKISPSALGTNDIMAIDSNRKISMGMNAPMNQILHLGTVGTVAGSATATTTITLASSYLHIGGTEYTANSYRMITFGLTSNTSAFAFYPPAYFGYQEKSVNNYSKGDLIFGTRSVITDTQPTERMRITNDGKIGIGTSSPYSVLSVVGEAVITATTTIGASTTVQQAGLQIGYGGICVDNDGSCTASTTGRVSAVELVTAASDLAEIYYSSDNLEAGDIVITKGNNLVGKADKDKQNSIIGVVSTKPGFILGLNGDSPGTSIPFGAAEYPIALAGRVPVKVSLEGGDISVGDPLTISSEYGVAKKATEAGKIIGYALEDFTSQTQDNATTTPKILTFLNLTYWFPTADIADVADTADNSDDSNIVSQSLDWILDQFKNIGVAIKDGVIQAKEFIADKIKTKELEMEDSATGESYCVKIVSGEWVKEKGVCGETNIAPPPIDNSDTVPEDNNINENPPAQDENNTQSGIETEN